MEQLKQLLKDLERISFQDISEIPEDKQHEVAEQIERLQDQLSILNLSKEKNVEIKQRI
tara:strand:- start:2772 stop:2948 length:177 start_codon:yes stop_codon:yes gene_type:complete